MKTFLLRVAGATPGCALLAGTSCLLALTVAGCGGSGDGVSIGTGQDPDPVVVDFPIAYVKAPLPLDAQGDLEQNDLREMVTFNFGADLFVRDRASPSAPEINVTGDVTQGLGAVRDVEISYDGTRVLFAMRGPVDLNLALDDPDQPTWNIWEYDIGNAALRRIIASDLSAEIGHDVAPHYLPDGRIIFSSTRQVRAQAILLDEGKPQFEAQDEDDDEPAFVLHVMEEDGSDIEQVSYNQSHDFDPSVLASGQVVFSRWDHAPGNNAVNLYRMNPDGSALELLYGQNSHDTGTNGQVVQFMQPRQLEDGRIMALVRPFTDTGGGGDIVVIDTATYIENSQPSKDNPGLTGPAQERATINDVSTEPNEPSVGGRYASVFPIQDGTGRLLVSWSQCRLTDVIDPANPPPAGTPLVIYPCTAENLADLTLEQADPLYGIWMYDPADDTQLPVVPGQEGFMFTEVVAADPRPLPPVVLDGSSDFLSDPNLANQNAGVINIRSVYDFDGGAVVDIDAVADPSLTTSAAGRPARFLRIVKAVSQPNDDLRDIDNTAFGVSAAQGMREILGYAPIEPDGSVMVKVPANVAFGVSVLDANGRRITSRHQNWMQLRPGQVLECNGCHLAQSGLSHGRGDAFEAAWAGAQVAGGSYFPSTVDALFVGEVGETMAEVRARISCATDGCSSLEPSMDIEYEDVWTDELKAGRAPDAPFSYSHLDLDTVPPTSLTCLTQAWNANCRIVINYETNIHPLWALPRPVLDSMGMPVLDGNGQPVTNTCTNCHNIVSAAGATVVPAGQLDLSEGQSDLEPDHFKSYQELLANDNELELDANGNLVERLVQVDIDPVTGDPIFAPVNVAPSMSVAGANPSNRFFSRFGAGQSHAGYLTEAELRLISEWLDVGAQYYNNPFDAPIN
ncbi:MAG: hypothetical protein OEW35_00805 [Gammaproteobacteria bacterium]|nr:hypothetical protein [Gammaproteobacteria bacterium]MDH4253210.1 hypothetical protein [Gammaproteobacteria bacterium]MDH5309011.1 hypothetical protein [Gammaproteobacteria bacterium]